MITSVQFEPVNITDVCKIITTEKTYELAINNIQHCCESWKIRLYTEDGVKICNEVVGAIVFEVIDYDLNKFKNVPAWIPAMHADDMYVVFFRTSGICFYMIAQVYHGGYYPHDITFDVYQTITD